MDLAASPSWENVRDQFSLWQYRPLPAALLEPYQFTFSSPYVQLSPDVATFACESFAPGRPILDAAMDLSRRIHAEFRYDLQSTTISTTLPEILQARAGVCQDFAHLFIGAARSMGLPARYVSGYLLTTPPAGQVKLIGSDASHAWASVFVPGNSPEGGFWADFDPTNDCMPGEKHVTLAWGRDFGDVSPLRGVVLGGGQHTVQVAVDVVGAT
jgi:transglutaminase-like putative cysteine protease